MISHCPSVIHVSNKMVFPLFPPTPPLLHPPTHPPAHSPLWQGFLTSPFLPQSIIPKLLGTLVPFSLLSFSLPDPLTTHPPTVPEIDISKATVFQKTKFSMLTPEVSDFLQQDQERKTAVLYGIEVGGWVGGGGWRDEGEDNQQQLTTTNNNQQQPTTTTTTNNRHTFAFYRQFWSSEVRGGGCLWSLMGHLLQEIGKERLRLRYTHTHTYTHTDIHTYTKLPPTHLTLSPFNLPPSSPPSLPQRIKNIGGILTTSESLLFELLKSKDHPKFKECSALLRAESPESGLAGLI